jgi:ubiquinone/menaquinone biosynthesis C-methylase UbiE
LIITNHIISVSEELSLKQKEFESLYIASRKKENRVYTDEQVLQLPDIESSHIHYSEWETRSRSAKRLIKYLENKNKPLNILEVGCGNGWLSAKLASISDATVLGTDINKTELEQAKRVFKNKINLSFAEGSISSLDNDHTFDVILFAASVQYFSSFENIIREAITLLNKKGEIHILDSFFYQTGAIDEAKQRSVLYYRSIGYEQMAEYYYHHSAESLHLFNTTFLFDPSSVKNKYFGKKDPFPWICIKAI